MAPDPENPSPKPASSPATGDKPLKADTPSGRSSDLTTPAALSASPLPRPTGILWAVSPENPLVLLEWFGWRRRPARHVLAGVVFIACIGAVFVARSGFPPGGGYSNLLYLAVVGPPPTGGPGSSASRQFWASVVTNFEKGVVRLTTILPWLLVIRAVVRLRRSGMWDSLRMTFLTPRDWVVGLAGPPILLGTVALAVFLSTVVLPDFLGRYGNYPLYLRTDYRLALVASIVFIGLEGTANGILVAAVTLYESLRSRQIAIVVVRSLGWILGIELLHAFAICGLAELAGTYQAGGSYSRYVLFSHAFQLTTLGILKFVPGMWLFGWLVRTLPAHAQREEEQTSAIPVGG